MKWIVYTDLDGTLLDFHTYSFDATKPAVTRLQERAIPLVFCSSKTRVEQEVYQRALKLEQPLIVENGSAILVPKGYFDFSLNLVQEVKTYQIEDVDQYQAILLGEPTDRIRKCIADARQQAGTMPEGYADLDILTIMGLTGLDQAAAQRAATRDYSETLLRGTGEGQAWDHFLQLLDQQGLQCVSGGKFYTVMGKGSDKGKAIKILDVLMRKKFGSIKTVGLGDSANDLPLLLAVDEPFLVQKPTGNWQQVDDQRINKVSAIGPAGFTQVIQSLLQLS